MPGITGAVGHRRIVGRVADAARRQLHFPWLAADSVELDDAVELSVVHRCDRSREYEQARLGAGGPSILIFGSAFLNGRGRLSAEDLLQRWSRDGLSNWHHLDGAFLAVIVDPKAQKLHLVNDMLALLPCYYARQPGLFAFAPEAKGLFALSDAYPKISSDGAISFLAAGFCLGDQTLFEGIQFLEPSSHIEVDLRTGEASHEYLYTMTFKPDPALADRREAEHQIHDAVVESVKLLLSDEPKEVGLFLSGGWDSRGVLMALAEVGRLPDYTQSWGLREDIRRSDPAVAAELARQMGIPHRFSAYDTDTFVDNAAEWAWISELSIDNPGWFAEGAGMVINEFDRGTDVFFEGDEVWGSESAATTEFEARAASFAPELGASLRSVLISGAVDMAEDTYRAIVDHSARRCPDELLADRREFFHHYIRIVRRVFAWGHFKELSSPQRRPLVTNAVQRVVAGLPPELRDDKTVYRSMLARRYPLVRKVPFAFTDALPDWNWDLRHDVELHQYFRSLLDANRVSAGVLGGLVDPEAVHSLASDYFSRSVSPVNRSQTFRLTTIDRIRRRPWGEALLQRRRSLKPHASHSSDDDVVRRIALITLLEEQITSRHGPALSAEPPTTSTAT